MLPPHLRHRKPATKKIRRPVRRSSLGLLLIEVIGFLILLGAIGVIGIIAGPGLPPEYDPFAEFDPFERPGILTEFKLNRALATADQCFAVLEKFEATRMARMLDREVSDQCHIRGHTRLRSINDVAVQTFSTRCNIAVRLALWEHHSLQPAAEQWLGSRVSGLSHYGSYACRPIHTPSGIGGRMSAHATASAVDISAFFLDDGRAVELRRDWWGGPNEREFLRAIRNGACDWFKTVLSPDFNTLHADHFHLAQGRWSACR